MNPFLQKEKKNDLLAYEYLKFLVFSNKNNFRKMSENSEMKNIAIDLLTTKNNIK